MSQARSAGLISGLTLVSRILGLCRELVFAALLGAGLYADAFQIAFRIPNLLRDLFAEGALSAAFIPTYARVLVGEGAQAAHRLANRLFTLLAALLGGLVLAGLVFAPDIVHALAPGYAAVPGKVDVTVLLTRVMLPFLPLVSFAAVAMGMLNAREQYGMPALAPAMFNLVTIAWAGLLWALGLDAFSVALGWSIGTLLGGAAQFLIQVPSLRREGWRVEPEWAPGDAGIRAMGRLMAPATLGLAAVQINIFVGGIYASQQPGAVSWLQYAFRILYLPIGIFGVAVGTIAGVGLARRAAQRDMDGVRDTLRRSLRGLAFVTVPATVGLVVLARPIVRLLYERGRFSPLDTSGTADALVLYSAGLVAYTAVKVLAPAFYALGSPRVPLAGSALAVATNVSLILLLYPRLGYLAVALGTSLGAFANAAVLAVVIERRVGAVAGSGLAGACGRMLAAAAAMGLLAWSSAAWLVARVGDTGLGPRALVALVPVVLGIACYAGLTQLLGLDDARSLWRAVSRRR